MKRYVVTQLTQLNSIVNAERSFTLILLLKNTYVAYTHSHVRRSMDI